MDKERVLLADLEFDEFKVKYYVLKAVGFGIGIKQTAPTGEISEDFVYDIFGVYEEAKAFTKLMADNYVLSESLREILSDYFEEKINFSKDCLL